MSNTTSEKNTGKVINGLPIWERTHYYTDNTTIIYEYVRLNIPFEVSLSDLEDINKNLIEHGSIEDEDRSDAEILSVVEGNLEQGLERIYQDLNDGYC